jgi:predicted GNAT family N-acyltransferase
MAATPFITFLPPSDLSEYDVHKDPFNQPEAVPSTFVDAMTVRYNVFVKEQGVPAGLEADLDDPRSCHWVVYASVNTITQPEERDSSGNIIRRKQSVTKSEPIGTLRLVPFPHLPHPTPGASYDTEEPEVIPALSESAPPPYSIDRATTFHDGKEAYVKFGRISVIKEFRGHGIASLLVNTALLWLQANPTFFNPTIEALNLEQTDVEHVDNIPKWKGLVCVHAQKSVQKTWAQFGFQLDEGMGEWLEANIPHVGMFKRLEI